MRPILESSAVLVLCLNLRRPYTSIAEEKAGDPRNGWAFLTMLVLIRSGLDS
jgi:hypothetical protein